MNFPPPPPASQTDIAPGSDRLSGLRSARPQHSAWGLPPPTTAGRRGLTPLSTDVAPPSLDSTVRRPGQSNSPSITTTSASPFASTFSSVLNSSSRNVNSRHNSSNSSSASPFTPLQTGSHTNQLLLSPRSRAITTSSNSHLASSAAAPIIISQEGGGGSGGGGGSSRTSTFSPSLPQHILNSPTNTTFDRSAYTISATTPSNSGQSSVSKIVVTQVFLLLGSITEKEGKVKWDSQAEAIRKLVESNGMEVFSKFFRRLLVGNSPQIFPGISRNVENPGNYQMLVQEMEKITQDPEQALKIAETIDTSEGDIFRDFDLATLMEHFKLDPLARTLLASAFTHLSKTDLKTKGGAILFSNFPSLLQVLANSRNDNYDIAPSLLATSAFKFLQDLPPTFRHETDKARVSHALNLRYSKQNLPLPPAIRSALVLVDLLGAGHELAKDIQGHGPGVTASLEAAKETLAWGHTINEAQVAGALLFMILTPDWQLYRPLIFVSAVRESVERNFEWQQVVRGFDRHGLAVSKDQFLTLFNALLPIAQQDPQFDIQTLWGGRWRHPATQLSFVLAFTSLPPSELDATVIPGLRQAYDPDECVDGPEAVAQHIDEARRNAMISVDAVTAIFDLVLNADNSPSPEDTDAAKEVVGANIGFFLCSAVGVPKPWTPNQQSIMAKMLTPFLVKQQPDYSFVLHCLWKQDKQWVAARLIETHLEDPIKLPVLLEHAQEHGWLGDLCTMMNGFGVDLAALAHRRGYLDLNQWAQDKMSRGQNELAVALSKFLLIKAQDEMRTVRKEQPAPRTVSLSIKTVYTMLDILEEHTADRPEELVSLERQCIQAFPRLINYDEGYDDIIENNGIDSNSLSDSTDEKMQELYKRMYSNDLEVRDIIESLQEYKNSLDSDKQDLFACMVHGLFDEYVCFNEYPLVPLATTAVLFGGIISCGLISDLTLRVGLGMVLEAVRDYNPETSMYKFGLQALLHFLNRLEEWPGYCNQLVQVPGLQGTEAYGKAVEVLGQNAPQGALDSEVNGVNGLLNLTNGDLDDFLSPETNIQQFKSVHADPRPPSDLYEDPDEQTQDKVLFVLNNVSEQNLDVKLNDLQDALDERHHHWFASYLVQERAKLQPNYQQLYLDVLQLLGNKTLWAEVLRETFVGVQKLLNAESTLNSATERTHLKNLGTWLGSLTIARDKPIKHKNISFKDLLIEGYESQRLLLVIPFTCKVLNQATKSVIFKPPNPWLMEIIRTLLELYTEFELKLNQKFDIEILCQELNIDLKTTEPSQDIRDRRDHANEMAAPMLPDGVDGFEDLSLGGINRGPRNSRFSPNTIAASLPDLEPLLVFPPSPGNHINQARLRQVVLNAVHRAILEIIAPVVERSVTIATIATTNLIHKDFARELDESRVRQSAQKMVRALSGSLALVTCKEPLRMSMSNYIRAAQNDMLDQAFPEGAILMCVNDNLDTACNIVEQQAEERSMPEIETHIENEIALRRQHRAEHPSEPYIDPSYNRWAGCIPDPFKISSEGLNEEQMAIYLEFARQTRGPANHVQTSSTDSGRQLPDILQEAFASVPSLPTPAEPPAIPHQPPQQQQQGGRMLPPPISTAAPQPQVNGYMDLRAIQERIQDLRIEIGRLSKETPEQHFKDLGRESPIMNLTNSILHLVMSSSPNLDQVALAAADQICSALYETSANSLEVEVLVQILQKLCQISLNTNKDVIVWFGNQMDDKVFHVPVTVSLLDAGLMELEQVDMTVAKALREREMHALEFLSDIMNILVLDSHPKALRADFASSLGAMGLWLADEPTLWTAKDLVQRLKEYGVPEVIETEPDERSFFRQRQMQYIFTEWISICSQPNPAEKTFTVFISQLHQRQLLNSSEDMALFFRLSIDDSVDAFEREDLNPNGAATDGYFNIDCLAKLIVLLVKNQGESEGAVKISKCAYMNSMLSLITLILNNHHVMRGELFSQRVFFRLFSSILCDWHDFGREGNGTDREIILAFADSFLIIGPQYFPGFTYGWLTLVSHRIFMPALLKISDEAGWEPFAKIMEAMLSYASELLKPAVTSIIAKDLYRGALRVLLILHHDFPEFLAENHYRFCNIIPAHCTQFRNLVLSAYPSSFPELPDPFTAGLKVDRLEEIRKAPRIAGDIVAPLLRGNIKNLVDQALRSIDISDESIIQIADATYISAPKKLGSSHTTANVDSPLLHALVLYIGESAMSTVGHGAGPSFTNSSRQASLLSKLAKELQPEARYYFLSAIANQLRYPNSHTHYFSYALLHLFGTDLADQQESDVRQQITRVLLERLIVHRPHPWGLIITLLELLKNPAYMFWELPFIKAAPEIERLFGALFQHINQSPRALA